jgi:hypothetical protein
MTAIAIFLAALLVLQFLLAAHVTRLVLASDFYDSRQKTLQIALVWLLPVAGVLLVWMLLRPERPKGKAETEVEDEDIPESLFSEKHAPQDASD